MGVAYNYLPFRDRPDLISYLIHLIKNTKENGELRRMVRLEVHYTDWISWVHERKWHCKGDFNCKKGFKGRFIKYEYIKRV